MTSTPHNLNELNQGKPIAGFHKTRTGFWIGVSACLHIVLITALSLKYIKITAEDWSDPAGAPARAAAREEAERVAIGMAPTPNPVATNTSTTKPATTAKSTDNLSEEEMLKLKANTSVVKSTTEVAKPPAKPDDIGISLDDTNPNKK